MKLIFFLVSFIFNTIHCLPQVRVRPQAAVLLSSSKVHLICESNDTRFDAVVYWTYLGQRIELNPSIIEMDGNELRIFQFGDTAYTQPGAYACVVSTAHGFLESEPAMLSLPTLNAFRIANNAQNVLNITEGNLAIVPCELPKGNPRPVSIFSLDNNRIEIEVQSNRYKILPSGNLHIIDVRQSDSGTYRCAAKNPLTGETVNNSQITLLQVSKQPASSRERQALTTIYKPPVASKVLVGDNYTLECAIAGWPKPVIEWEKYGDILPDKRSEVIHGTLYLYNMRLEDRGTYICRASNANGQSDIAYTALVEVLEPPKVVQRPDPLIEMKKDESVSIKCSFRGRPEPTISWIYNGEELIINGSPVTGGLLSLNQPKEGIYQCIGRNSYGIAQANTALVYSETTTPDNRDSVEKSKLDLPPKRSLIVFGPNNATVYEGETVQLHCLTQPDSTVQWLHNNEMIVSNTMRRYEILRSGGLRIVSAQKSDSGIYECVASKIGFEISAAKCFVHVQGLGVNAPSFSVSKLEITAINQLDSHTAKLSWKINETIESYVQSIQIQHRSIHPRTSWASSDRTYNRSVDSGTVSNLQQDQTYKFRLIGLDTNGKQVVISATKRWTVESEQRESQLPVPKMTDAWITNDEHISFKWQIPNNTDQEIIDGFVIYYRPTGSNVNFTTITLPNLRYPPIDSYTISSVGTNQEYELRIATYSNRGLSSMSNSIKITVPQPSHQHHTRVNQGNPVPNLDEILENITKLQNPSAIKQNPTSPSSSPVQKSSDILYLIIGIIAGILLILLIILITMCVLRFFQRKKFLAHVKSATGSDYYCDGLHKSLNPEYAASPRLQHAVVSVDGKLIPFAYPTNMRSPKIYCHGLAHQATRNENGTMRLNANPLNHFEHENLQENFYHTLSPFSTYSQYEECPIHRHVVNYSSDTLPFSKNINAQKNEQCNASHAPFAHMHCHLHHHPSATYQRQCQSKGTVPSLMSKVDQEPSDDNLKHSAPPSTGSTHSSSGIGSSMESPYNHWKYLVPLSVATNESNQNSSVIIEPIPLTSS